MAVITNKDLDIMCDVEHLLHKKLEETNSISEDSEEYDIWIHYWNMVERFCQAKDKSREKARKFNKDNKEYHRLNVNLYAAIKRKDKVKEEYWRNKLKEFKENDSKQTY